MPARKAGIFSTIAASLLSFGLFGGSLFGAVLLVRLAGVGLVLGVRGRRGGGLLCRSGCSRGGLGKGADGEQAGDESSGQFFHRVISM